MSQSSFAKLAVGSALLIAATLATSTAGADHGDIIADKIPESSMTLRLERLADGFGTPLWGAAAPYVTTQLFVVDQFGTVTALSLADGSSHTFLDIGTSGEDLLAQLKTRGFDERGLLGLAFHPHYRKNGLLYTYSSEPLGPVPDFTTLADDELREDDSSLSVIREWRVDEPRRVDAVVNPASSRVLVRIEQPQTNHNAGALAFGPDAMLYIALGDGGARDDQGVGHGADGQGNAQDLSEGNLLGKILRIDPRGSNSTNGQYGIPEDNPFVDQAGADEVFAYGFRNPFRMSFDNGTGDLIAADVGQRDIEEVDRVVSGGNYGWPVKEGTFLFEAGTVAQRGRSGADSPGVPPTLIDPIAQYDHDEGTSVTGGFVSRGETLSAFEGWYIFGDLTLHRDLIAGRFFAITDDEQLVEIVPTNNADNRLLITGFGRDTQGDLYVMGLQPVGDGRPPGVVYKLVPE